MHKHPILITGGAGYIGSHAVKLFLTKGHKVIVIDNLHTGFKQAMERLASYGELVFIQGDLRDKNAVKKAFTNEIHTVIHFAAHCLVSESMQKPEEYFENNVLGSLTLFEEMQQTNVKNIIFSSTCATYGENVYVPIDEKHPQNPANPYGESKLMVEKILKWYSKIYGFNSIIFRYFNPCGADEEGIIGDSKKPSQLLMQNAILGALNLATFELTYQEVDTPDKSPIRDYVDVLDVVYAHYLAYDYLLDKQGIHDDFNIGSGTGSSVLEIVETVEKELGVTLERKKGTPRKGEYAKVYADYSKAKQVLGWEPKRSIRDSILALKNWYEKNPKRFEY